MKRDPNRPKVPEVMPLVHALYERHSAGCCLHIVLDDGNLEDSSVEFCEGFAREQGHAECQRLARLLGQMTWTQRNKLYAREAA